MSFRARTAQKKATKLGSARFGIAPQTTKTVKVKNLNKKTVKVSVAYEALTTQPGVTYSVSPGNLKIKAKKAKTFTVTMTVVPAQLRRTIDPTMAVTQENAAFGGQEARQFVPDSSGRLLVK